MHVSDNLSNKCYGVSDFECPYCVGGLPKHVDETNSSEPNYLHMVEVFVFNFKGDPAEKFRALRIRPDDDAGFDVKTLKDSSQIPKPKPSNRSRTNELECLIVFQCENGGHKVGAWYNFHKGNTRINYIKIADDARH